MSRVLKQISQGGNNLGRGFWVVGHHRIEKENEIICDLLYFLYSHVRILLDIFL